MNQCGAMLYGDPDEGDHICVLHVNHDMDHECDCGELW